MRTANGQFTQGNPGKPKGAKNKKTEAIRQAIQELVDGNIDQVQGWLDDLAKNDPNAALDKYLKLVEYVLPKLSRVDAINTIDTDAKPFRVEDLVRFKD